MWSFDNQVRDALKSAFQLLEKEDEQAFIEAQENVFFLVRDILEKERDVLYPTSLKLISDNEFTVMRSSDDEIGYCLVSDPPPFSASASSSDPLTDSGNQSLMADMLDVLQKHGVGASGRDEVLDVSMGKLTLEQINLIFRHLQIDLSYVDENDVVKFYSDTQHRVFPRSAGVIGREVQNCHPRESVETVEAIIEAFRKGEQDQAEFWLEMGGKFIYIIYNAVRDEEGNFRGVLEMMQDATHIRSLEGSRKLLTWDEGGEVDTPNGKVNEDDGIGPDSVIAPLLKRYPFLKEFLIALNPKFDKLNNPVLFKTMGNIATLDIIAMRGGIEVEELIARLKERVAQENE